MLRRKVLLALSAAGFSLIAPLVPLFLPTPPPSSPLSLFHSPPLFLSKANRRALSPTFRSNALYLHLKSLVMGRCKGWTFPSFLFRDWLNGYHSPTLYESKSLRSLSLTKNLNIVHELCSIGLMNDNSYATVKTRAHENQSEKPGHYHFEHSSVPWVGSCSFWIETWRGSHCSVHAN